MSRKPNLGVWLVAVVLLVAGFYAGTTVLQTRAFSPAAPVELLLAQADPGVLATPSSESEETFSQIFNNVAQSVVNINVVARVPGAGNFGTEEEFAEGTGTGFVIDQQGHIVTNNHVVDGAQRIEVSFYDGRIVRAEIVGLDPDSDLAVIQVSDVPAEALRPVTFADSGTLFIGQEVVAIGSPFGEEWTMTTGIVSALNRTIEGLTNFSIGSVIQTDAAINPGNSGGPLFNLNGEVIGVNSQIISRTRSSAGIGFAIPSNLVTRAATELIENGRVSYSYLGIGGDEINLYYIEALNLPSDTRGAVVTGVQPDSPAADAGLQNITQRTQTVRIDGAEVPVELDIITAIDGTPINGMNALIAYLASETQPGDTVTLSVLRNGSEQLELSVVLSARPSGN